MALVPIRSRGFKIAAGGSGSGGSGGSSGSGSGGSGSSGASGTAVVSFPYPLQFPPVPGFQSLALRMQGNVGVNVSPFTGQQQTYEFPAEWWEADVALPAILDRGVAEQWFAFLAALRGESGTFLMGDPLGRFPQGAALGSPMMPDAASLSTGQSKTLLVTGWDKFVPRILRPGDYLEIGRNFLSNANNFAGWVKQGFFGSGGPPTVQTAGAQPPSGGLPFADIIHFAAGGSGSLDASAIYQDVTPPVLGLGWPFTIGVWLQVPYPQPPTVIYLSVMAGTPSFSTDPSGATPVSVGNSWGYFQAALPAGPANIFDAPGGGPNTVRVGLFNPPGAAAVSINAWSASLDDGLTRRRLHKVLTEQDSDQNGSALFDIFPRLRETPDEAAPVNVFGARGMFRLALGQQKYLRNITMDQTKAYGIQFSAMEAF